MEFLPKVKNPTVHEEQVPYLCESSPSKYDSKDWILWPERAGMWGHWNSGLPYDVRSSRLPWENCNWDFSLYCRCDPQNTAAFIQSWLSVGLLASILQSDAVIVQGNYVRLQNGERIFSTSNLDKDLAILTVDLSFMDRIARRDRLSTISSNIQHAKKVIMSLHPSSDQLDVCPVPPIAILSIEVMLDTIIHAFNWAEIPMIPPWNHKSSHVIKSMLQSQKFCPSDIAWIQSNFSSSTQYFLSRLGPRSSDREHQQCEVGECLAMMMVEENYSAVHRSFCNGACTFIGIDEGQHSEILSAGYSVVIQYDDSMPETFHPATQNQPRLKALSSSEVENYVAISHVWSDGLGNPYRNEVPSCQLSWLASLVRQILPEGESINFWLDTLCVPASEIHRVSRKQAISLIGESFENALVVLVLDRQCYVTPSGASDAENMGRILLSNWQRRLWTLMEAVSARRLMVAFSDALIPLEDIEEKVVGEWAKKPLTVVEHGLQLAVMTTGLSAGALPADKFVSAYHRAQRRATSHREDEIICIAVMAGFTSEEMQVLLSKPVSDRYIHFLRKFDRLPVYLCFIDVPRLDVDRFHWCPKNFITRDEKGHLTSQPPLEQISRMGIMQPLGLQFSSAGFLFKLPTSEIIQPERSTLVVSHPQTDLRSMFFFEEHHETAWRSIMSHARQSSPVQFAIILASEAPTQADGSAVDGAIVIILEAEDIADPGENAERLLPNIYYARFVMTCLVGTVNATDWVVTLPEIASCNGGPRMNDQIWVVQ